MIAGRGPAGTPQAREVSLVLHETEDPTGGMREAGSEEAVEMTK